MFFKQLYHLLFALILPTCLSARQLLVAVFVFQATNGQAEAASQPLCNIPFPFVWYKTPEECGQWQDESAALSSTLTTDVKCESEHVDDNREDNVLCDLLSRHVNEVNTSLFADADKQHAEIQNHGDEATDSSSRVTSPGAQKTYACNVCPETFSSSSFLATREHIHTGMMPHTHTGELMPYVCDLCQKQFSCCDSFNTHKLIHAGETPHKCDICTKAFATSRDLTRHKRTHTGSKPHTCDVCQKQFSEAGHLKKHKRAHTGSKPRTAFLLPKLTQQTLDRSRCNEASPTMLVPYFVYLPTDVRLYS